MSTVKQTIMLEADTTPSSGDVCIANISTEERRKRLRFGILSLTAGLIVLAILMAIGADRWWRLPLFLFFAGAGTGYFQWHDKTCVGLARVNSRKTGDTYEKIEDAAELAQVKRQARRVQIKAVLAAIPLTLIALAVPVVG